MAMARWIVPFLCLALSADGFVPPVRWATSGPLRHRGARTHPSGQRPALSPGVGCTLSARSQASDTDSPHRPASGTGQGTRVCIVGGGFGGLYTALQLVQLLPLQGESERAKITVVNSGDRFVFLPLLYELVTGELQDWEVAPLYSDLLEGTGIEFVHGSVSSLDHEKRTVGVDLALVAGGGSTEIVYDKIVLATGASSFVPAEAAAAGALPFVRVEDAKSLRARLGQLRFDAARRRDQRRKVGKPERPAVAIVGGGYSGVELACSLAQSVGQWADVKLVHRGDQLMPAAARFNRITSYQELRRRGVSVSTRTSVSDVGPSSLTLKSGDEGEERVEPYDILVWTAGTAINALADLAQLPTTPEGRLPVDTYLRVRGGVDMYSLGDGAECYDAMGDKMAPNAQVAVQQAQALAWNLHADITGGVPVKFRYQNLGEMVTMGRYAAGVSSEVFGLGASGAAGAAMRRVTYWLRMPNNSHRAKLAASWLSRLPSEVADYLSSDSAARSGS